MSTQIVGGTRPPIESQRSPQDFASPHRDFSAFSVKNKRLNDQTKKITVGTNIVPNCGKDLFLIFTRFKGQKLFNFQ